MQASLNNITRFTTFCWITHLEAQTSWRWFRCVWTWRRSRWRSRWLHHSNKGCGQPVIPPGPWWRLRSHSAPVCVPCVWLSSTRRRKAKSFCGWVWWHCCVGDVCLCLSRCGRSMSGRRDGLMHSALQRALLLSPSDALEARVRATAVQRLWVLVKSMQFSIVQNQSS
jgi:hypothetical protein